MATFLLDTTVIIDALNKKKNRSLLLISLVEQGNTLACCPISVAEVYAGLRPREEQLTESLLRSLQLYPISFSVAELAGRLKREHSRKGKTLSLPDTIVAAVAIHNQLTLITDNPKGFPMADLVLYTLPDSR